MTKELFPERSLALPCHHRLGLLPGAAGSLGCGVSYVVSVVMYGYSCSGLRMAAISAAPDAPQAERGRQAILGGQLPQPDEVHFRGQFTGADGLPGRGVRHVPRRAGGSPGRGAASLYGLWPAHRRARRACP